MRRLAALGLSEEQKAEGKEILDGTRKKMEDLSSKARDGSLDLEAVRKEHERLRKETDEAIKALLASEQAEKWAKPPMPPPQGPPHPER